jgi:hypothetical protein
MSVPAALLKEFILSLSGKARDHRGRLPAGTAELPGLDLAARWKHGPFDAQQQLTKTALQSYLLWGAAERYTLALANGARPNAVSKQ